MNTNAGYSTQTNHRIVAGVGYSSSIQYPVVVPYPSNNAMVCAARMKR